MNKFFDKNFAQDEEFIATLRLARSNGMGVVTFFKLLNKFKTPSKIIANAGAILNSRNIKLCSEQEALAEVKNTQQMGGNVISIFDNKYPELLAEIPNPPLIISYLGDIEKLEKNTVAIVGSRYASANAVTFAYKIAGELMQNNITTVSGLARGIDTAAHKGSVAVEATSVLPTIAVIAGGLDNIYPKENENLYYKLAENSLIITENKLGVKPKSENFPRRNRIISGISQGVLVIEAAIKSGSLITARYAAEQGREVMAVPGFPLDKKSEGTNKLLKNGATLITNVADIQALFEYTSGNKIKQQNLFKENDAKLISELEITSVADEVEEQEASPEISEVILNKITTTPIEIEVIADQTNINIQTVNSILLEYELDEKIIREPGGKVALKA